MTTTVGEYLANIIMTGVDEGVGNPSVVHSFQVLASEGRLELPRGNAGDVGPQGPPAYPWRWRGDVADYTALQAIESTLTTAHRGYAYRIVGGSKFPNSVMYWDGETFYPFLSAFGAEGPRGSTPTLTVGTITTLAAGSNAYLTVDATDPLHLVLNAGFPRGGPGEQGDQGGPGPIIGSPDVKPGLTPVQGDVLIWDATNSYFDRAPYPGWKGPYTLVNGDFSTGSNVSAAATVVATRMIPPQPFQWRPFVMGALTTIAHVASVGAGRVDLEVRIGSSTGQIVAVAPGLPAANTYTPELMPYFGASMDPSSSVGAIPANTTATLYFVLRRAFGSNNYSWENSAAHAAVYCQPVYAP